MLRIWGKILVVQYPLAWSIRIRPFAIHFEADFKTVDEATPLPEANDPYQSIGLVKPIDAATRITRASISP